MSDDAFDQAMAQVRLCLVPHEPTDRPLRMLAAAAFFAICAMAFCAAAILAPSNVTTPSARSSVG
jgi:hypothetical protein